MFYKVIKRKISKKSIISRQGLLIKHNDKKKNSKWIVFFHGFMGGHQDWESIYPKFIDKANVLLVDLPGHGNTPWSDNINSFEKFSDQFELLCKKLHIERMILIGYSLGGRLAASYAAKYPDRINRLILESTHLGLTEIINLTNRHDKKKSSKINVEIGLNQNSSLRVQKDLAKKTTIDRVKKMKEQSMADFVQQWYQSELFAISFKKMPDKYLNIRVNQKKSSMVSVLQSFSIEKQGDLTPALSKVAFDICYICGNQDQKYVDLGKKYAKNCNNLNLFEIESADHNVHVSKSDEWVNYVLKCIC